jgi:pimeloyl-ACP methyl ester carboxylesterase
MTRTRTLPATRASAGRFGGHMRKAVAGGRLFATTYGSSPYNVLALPGWMRTIADFDAVLTGLPGAVAIDLPGFGGVNPEPDGVWGAAEYATEVAPALDDLDLPVVIVGHSRGGAVAVHLAARRPDAVKALVLVGVPLLHRASGATNPSLGYRIARGLHRRKLLPDSRMEALRHRRGSDDYRNARGVMRDVLVKVTNETYEDQLSAIRCPVELVWGANDDAVPVEIATRAAAMIGDGRAALTVLDGVGHHVPLQAPDAIRAAIARHL